MRYNADVRSLSVQPWMSVLPSLLIGGVAAGSSSETLPIDANQEADLLRVAGPGFSLKRTAHFVIAYDTEGSLVDGLTGRLEQTYHMVYRFCEMKGIAVRRPDRRLEVLFFDRRGAYDRYGASIGFRSAGSYGVYFESTNRSAFFNVANDPELIQLQAAVAAARRNIDDLVETMNRIRGNQVRLEIQFPDGRRIAGTKAQVKKELTARIGSTREELDDLDGRCKTYSDRINRTVIQHETAHQVLYNAGVHVRGASNPKWVVEGLACLFETPPGPTGTAFAAINQLRLHDFRSAVAGGSEKRRLTWRDYDRAVAAGRLVLPQRLITEPRLFAGRGGAGAAHYAATWALTHFLQRAHGDQLAAYLKEASSRAPGADPTPAQELALFEKHFGPMDQVFLRRFSGYILRLGVSGVKNP